VQLSYTVVHASFPAEDDMLQQLVALGSELVVTLVLPGL
jgi:hypothetical protein